MSLSLTPEQQRRIEENRKRALARRAEKQAQLTSGSAQTQHTQPISADPGPAKKFASDRAHPGAPDHAARQVGTHS